MSAWKESVNSTITVMVRDYCNVNSWRRDACDNDGVCNSVGTLECLNSKTKPYFECLCAAGFVGVKCKGNIS